MKGSSETRLERTDTSPEKLGRVTLRRFHRNSCFLPYSPCHRYNQPCQHREPQIESRNVHIHLSGGSSEMHVPPIPHITDERRNEPNNSDSNNEPLADRAQQCPHD